MLIASSYLFCSKFCWQNPAGPTGHAWCTLFLIHTKAANIQTILTKHYAYSANTEVKSCQLNYTTQVPYARKQYISAGGAMAILFFTVNMTALSRLQSGNLFDKRFELVPGLPYHQGDSMRNLYS